MAKKSLKPKVVSGGKAIPVGKNYYYMKGRKHEQGGIDIGADPKSGLEVEDGEVMHLSKDGVKVFSAQPILNGQSPAEKVLGGDNPNDVFNAQEEFKDRNKLNDDGSRKFRTGGLSRAKDYGSSKKPYPKVKKGDFAGGGRSYPIPTKADAVDALRLAGLHGRSDVKSKVYSKYPELKKDKKEIGGESPKYKLVEITIGGNKRLIRVPSSTGERQKAALGSDGFERYDPIINESKRKAIDNKLGFRINPLQYEQGVVPQSGNTDGFERYDPIINESKRKAIDNKLGFRINPLQYEQGVVPQSGNTDGWQHETPAFKTITPTDYIGLGANTIGSLASGISNRKTIKSMRYSNAPTPIAAAKLKTRININPQIDKLRETVNRYYRDVDANTASSRVALARKGRASVDALLKSNELYGNKENTETQLINQDKMNQQAVRARNIEQYNRWAAGKAYFENKKREMLAENTISTMEGLNSGIQDLIGRIEVRRNNNNTLAMLSTANPNVTAQLLRDNGLRADYYVRDGETHKQARQRIRKEKQRAKDKKK